MADGVLQDKVVLVNGAGRGIGQAIALGLESQGAKVVVVSRTLPELENVAKKASKQGNIIPFVADLRNLKEIKKLFQFCQICGFLMLQITRTIINKKNN